jgi:uncharacterized protein (DUF302 family)
LDTDLLDRLVEWRTATSYAHTITVNLPFAAAVQATRDALAGHGFGVIADIDIRAAFASKLGDDAAAELGDYLILGACNPHLAQKALRDEPDLGLLLPCNVVIRRAPDAIQQQFNRAHNAVRAIGERGNSLLKTTFKALRNISLWPVEYRPDHRGSPGGPAHRPRPHHMITQRNDRLLGEALTELVVPIRVSAESRRRAGRSWPGG